MGATYGRPNQTINMSPGVTAGQQTTSSSAQGSNRRATTQLDGPGNRTADGERNGARPGMTTLAGLSGKHRRPAQKAAGGRQTGDVVAPND